MMDSDAHLLAPRFATETEAVIAGVIAAIFCARHSKTLIARTISVLDANYGRIRRFFRHYTNAWLIRVIRILNKHHILAEILAINEFVFPGTDVCTD